MIFPSSPWTKAVHPSSIWMGFSGILMHFA
jgi:hypothetical protein